VYQNLFLHTGSCVDLENISRDHTIYNNTCFDVQTFFNPDNLCASGVTLFNNLSVSSSQGLIDWGGWLACDQVSEQSFDWVIDYSDYNSVSGDFTTYVHRRKSPSVDWNLDQWQANTGFGLHDSAGEDPGFLNPGGMSAADYRRNSYPTDGRGGDYPSVRGAYITGSEVIGYAP
jgi:hypothetical protein